MNNAVWFSGKYKQARSEKRWGKSMKDFACPINQ
jgi:hypothetical protein